MSRNFEIGNWRWLIEDLSDYLELLKMKNFMTSVFQIATTAKRAILELWEIILSWARESLSPWISDNLAPIYKDIATEAFVVLDKLTTPLKRAVKKAWETLRKFLVSALVTFNREILPDGNFQWYRTWSSKIINMLEPKKPVIIYREEKIEIDFSDLPLDVRELFYRSNEDKSEIDALQARDEEMKMVT